jgi:UDP-GlcNAc:undecaprenyl-phosphate/decaprenyl-phosphate GlcNAc-1-phosphate transferase
MMQMVLSVFTSFIIALMMIPALIRIAAHRNIFDEPGERKLHKTPTPLLGGVAIFAGTLISFLFWSSRYFEPQHLYILASLMILFIAGFIDDLQPLRPVVKLFLQVVAAALTVLFAGISLTGLHGLFGLHQLSGIFPFIISLFFMLVIVNAFNFIDGIDGLAASTGIIASAFFGILFLSINDHVSAMLSFALCGSLLAFLLFNASPAKIFMGDTGTLVTGFILSLLTIQLTEGTRTMQSSFPGLNYQSAPVFALALLIIPITDFLRVTTVRLLKGHSPVKADKNHIHHVLVTLGLNHAQTVLVLLFINLLFIAAVWMCSGMNQSVVFFSLLGSGGLLSQLPYLLVKIKMKKSSL